MNVPYTPARLTRCIRSYINARAWELSAETRVARSMAGALVAYWEKEAVKAKA